MDDSLKLDEGIAESLFEGISTAVIVADERGRIRRMNAEAEKLFGWQQEEVRGEPVEVLLPERLREQHADQHAVFMHGTRDRAMTSGRAFPARRKDGTEFQAEIGLSRVRTPRGVLVLALVRDLTEKLQAEAALRKAAAEFHALIEQASDGIFIADLSGRYTEVNTAACRLLGYTREELIGKTILELIPAEDAPRLAEDRTSFLRGEARLSEWRLRHKDGTFVPVEVSASILPDGRWQAIVRDISARKAAEEALRRSQEALARAQRVAQLGSWDWNLVTNTIERSEELYAMFGVEPHTGPSAPLAFLQLIPYPERTQVERALEAAVQDGRPFKVEHRLRRPDGTERWVRHQGEATLENGRATRLVGTLLDITELKTSELQREQALRRLGAVLEQAPAGIIILEGEQGETVEMNERARHLLGSPASTPPTRLDQVAGRTFGPDGRALSLDELPGARALRGEQVESMELQLAREDGRVVPVLAHAAPLRNERGTRAAVVVLEEISALKELERLRTEWNSIVAHDLRQPLNAIGLYARILLKKLGHVADAERISRQILRGVQQLDRMVGDLLDLSRLEAKRMVLEKEPTDLMELARSALERAALEARDNHFELHANAPLPRVDVDPGRIEQVLDNLLSNAWKYGRAGSAIALELAAEAGQVCVSVTNEGPGISEGQRARLFQRFYRTEDARRGGRAGTGMGLHICRELVEAHGGRLGVESRPNETTTFRFSLPALPQAHPSPQDSEPGETRLDREAPPREQAVRSS